jgi:hypothetical protein
LKIEINDRGDPLRLPRDTLYPQKLALTSPTSGGRSISIIRLRTKATKFIFFSFRYLVGFLGGGYHLLQESTITVLQNTGKVINTIMRTAGSEFITVSEGSVSKKNKTKANASYNISHFFNWLVFSIETAIFKLLITEGTRN